MGSEMCIRDRILGGSGVDLRCIRVYLGGSRPAARNPIFPSQRYIYTSIFENLSKIYRTSIEHLSNIYQTSMDPGWTWGRSWVDRGWILGVSGCIWVDHGPPPETQFSLVNDTFTQAFGRSMDKRFFILHAPPSARRNVRSQAFGCCCSCCWLSLGKNKDRLRR